MSQSPLQQLSDFDFTFDPSLSNIFPNPPPLPASADLFSPAETTDLLGFLDAFGDFNWADLQNIETGPNIEITYPEYTSLQNNGVTPYSNPHLNTAPEPSTRPKINGTRRSTRRNPTLTDDRHNTRSVGRERSTPSDKTSSPVISTLESPTIASSAQSVLEHYSGRSKQLLSTPQKRLNHIMSEQKRRNAIRDGYAQLISLLSPGGSAPVIGMPTRGRPKGSGSRGKGQSKGKSGVLFRAVEYCRWLEEGRDALREEVLRLEAAAGIRHH